MSKLETNLTQGSVAKQLLRFALPFVLSTLLQATYSIADMIIVGQFAGYISMSGVNIGGQVTQLVLNSVFGIAGASTILIGQYLGAGDRKALESTISTMFTFLLRAGIVLTVVMIGLRTPILRLIRTPEVSFGEAKNYLLITALGTLFLFGYNALSAVMRGMGDSRRPLIFVGIACATNVVLDIIAVAVLGMGALGAGLATIISQGLSMVLCIIYLKKHDFPFSFSPKSFKIDRERLKVMLRVGIPMSVQNVCTSFSFLFLTTMVNTLDPLGIASAAVGAVGKFNAFGVMPAFAMSSAIAAMCAQNLGAGQTARAVKTMKIGISIGFSFSFAVFLFTRFAPELVLQMFTDDPALVTAGVSYLSSFGWDYIIVALHAGLNGLFIGAGHTTFSFINGVMSALLVRIPVCYVFGMLLDMGLFGIGLGAPVASGIAFMIGVGYYLSGKWKTNKIIRREPLEQAM